MSKMLRARWKVVMFSVWLYVMVCISLIRELRL